MVSCDSLRQIFETPLSGNPTLSSRNHNKSKRPELSSFTELFGELHFKESLESSSLPFLPPFPSPSPSPSSSSLLDLYSKPDTDNSTDHEKNKDSSFQSLFGAQKNQERRTCPKNKDGFSSMNSESLHMCTEGLGFESFDDVDDDSSNEKVDELKKHKEKVGFVKHSSYGNLYSEHRKFRSFPPPIPSIGRNGKPWVSYKSFRCDGRLVLKEVTIPTQGQEFMHACREDGRLTLHLVHRDEEIQQDKEKSQNEDEMKEDVAEEDYGKGKLDNDEID